ncbi:hypothetical protein M413DRAFT_424385 [Hebeloma cylindrosporum]|uniref:non-specific serine/threonine protein kinase n=1 Tax=Hebeloma cylindrosporum TaxID=76867 RepID=A0A0C2Y6M6_HEBCY|nr:hypothetical protein M413DRAFT_424385 [Hebeloma cylindrosporum h7]
MLSVVCFVYFAASIADRPRKRYHSLKNLLDFPSLKGGGFYAAGLKSTLNSRYTLIGKLGWGIYSSVWLARDVKQLEPARQRYVAVKILSTHATEVQGRLASELKILQHINNNNARAHPGRRHISTLLDKFTIADHHGPHLCLVFEAAGAFKGPIYNPGQGLPVPFVKNIVRQLLSALDFLHRECRIIHTDLKPDNILITLPDAEEAIQRYMIAGTESPASSPDVLSPAMVDGFHAELIQPYALRAPEVILGKGWDTSADIWSLGCLLFEFLTGKWLFSPRSGPTWSAEGYHLAHMRAISGEAFDLAYIQGTKDFERYFSPEGHHRIQILNVRDLEQALDAYRVLSDAEKPICVDFLRSMLRLKPTDRASAAELLAHEWIRSSS